MRTGVTIVLALTGACLAVGTGVGLDRVVMPGLDGGNNRAGTSTVVPGEDPAEATTPELAQRQEALAPPQQEPEPQLRPLRAKSPAQADKDDGSGDSGGPGGTNPGGGAQVPTGASGPETAVAQLTNKERAKAGCGALRIDQRLVTAARRHSADMAANNYFDHNSQNGDTPWTRIKRAGYSSPAAENIARGQPTPASVMSAWMNSPGHRANILNCRLKAIGVGMQAGRGGPWWTQDFGSV